MDDNPDIYDWIRAIQRTDTPEVDKLKEFFGQITAQIIEYAEREIELARAMCDSELLVKHQIKMETIKTAREIFARGYQVATARTAWDEHDKR
jgi:hypothetical protein